MISVTLGDRFSWRLVDGPQASEVLVFDGAQSRTHLLDALCSDIANVLETAGTEVSLAQLMDRLFGEGPAANEQEYTQAQATLSATLNTMASLGMVRLSQPLPN